MSTPPLAPRNEHYQQEQQQYHHSNTSDHRHHDHHLHHLNQTPHHTSSSSSPQNQQQPQHNHQHQHNHQQQQPPQPQPHPHFSSPPQQQQRHQQQQQQHFSPQLNPEHFQQNNQNHQHQHHQEQHQHHQEQHHQEQQQRQHHQEQHHQEQHHQEQHHQEQQQPTSSPPTSPTSAARQLSTERADWCDEYRISPVSVSVRGPLSLRFPGSEYAEVSIPYLAADVVVISSLADSCCEGDGSLGLPRQFVRDAELDRETGVVSFTVTGVRTFADTTLRMRPRVEDNDPEKLLVAAKKLLWLVTGKSMHDSPASDLVSRAANALHAVAALKQEVAKSESTKIAKERNEMRLRRRKNLEAKWEQNEEVERQTNITRTQFMQSPPEKQDARKIYTEQLQDMLMQGIGQSPIN